MTILALTGCVGLPPLNVAAPTISLADLTLDAVGRDGVRFRALLATRNPNPIDLPISRLSLGFEVLGQPIAVGRLSDDKVVLPARGERDVPVTFEVSSNDLRAVAARLFTARTLPETVWELKGTAYWGDGVLPLPFSKRGDASALRRLRDVLMVPRP